MLDRRGVLYVYGKVYDRSNTGRGGGGGRNVYLHRWILGLEDDDPRVVNHLNWDPTDCTDENMRVVTADENRAHRHLRSVPARNNSSGHRNIFHRGSSYIVVVAGRYVGSFGGLREAKRAAANARAEYASKKLSKANTKKRL